MNVTVLGTGLIGEMIVRELAASPVITHVTAIDGNQAAIDRIVSQLDSSKVTGKTADLGSVEALAALLRETDAAVAALPHALSMFATQAAAETGTHLVDLVGSRYEEKLAFHDQAVANGALIIPGCGVAPGIVNVLAARGIELLDEAEEAIMYCGGLPKDPLPPLWYQIVFRLESVMGLYTRDAIATENGEIVSMPPMSGLEDIEFDAPAGLCEAAYSDAHSTAHTLRHKVKRLAEKTVRYKGHFQKLGVLNELGFLDLEPVEVDGVEVVPRHLAMKLLEPRMKGGSNEDITVVRVDARGTADGKQVEHRWEMVDVFDTERNYTSMAKTTGFPVVIAIEWLAKGKLTETGFLAPEQLFAGDRFDDFISELAGHGVHITHTQS